MTIVNLERMSNNDSIRLFEEDSSFKMTGLSLDDSSAHVPTHSTPPTDSTTTEDDTLVDKQNSLKSVVQDEFLHFVKSQDSISQLSFCVNDSASGDKTFEQVYEMGGVLGEGGFAFVYQCQHRFNHRTYAVKEVIKKDHTSTNGEEIKQEISALRRVRESPYFVGLLDVFDEPTTTYLIMEEMKGGDLLDKLGEIEVYEEWEARKVARQLLEAIHYCHKRRICHRDIKPENILLPRADDITTIKLADFGCARQWAKPNEMQTLCGSPQYVAPEVVGDTRPEGVGYNCQCDLWSIGVVLYIILGGYAPFESEDEEELLDLICNADFEFHDDYWNDIEEPPKDLISQLLEVDPKKRLTARQALKTPWLRRRDRDWVQEMNDSSSTFQGWLERRNNSIVGNNSGHTSLGSLSLAVGGNPNDSNSENMSNWEIDADSEHQTDAKSFASEPGPLQDSASTHAYVEADLCSE